MSQTVVRYFCRKILTKSVVHDVAYRGFNDYGSGSAVVRTTRFFGMSFALLFLAAARAFVLCSFAAFISFGALVRSCLM